MLAVDFKLYLITDRHASTLPLPQAIRLALEGGVRAIQLRDKDLPVRELLTLAGELRVVTREYGARLLINDRVDVAVAMDADGVHLGSQSMPCSLVRKIIGRNRMIGVSTHSLHEAKNAEEEGADFITFGPVYSTPSKSRFGPPVGLEELKRVKKKIDIPHIFDSAAPGSNPSIGGFLRDRLDRKRGKYSAEKTSG